MDRLKHKKIIHIDMDAFYASVEQMDRPDLLGCPVAVGGGSERGVVAAASYEARKFGVRSAMSGKLAKLKCPELIFIKPRFGRYKEISSKIREIFFQYTDLVEPLSLDEAYLDVTVNKKDMPSATLIAQEIRHRIHEEIGLRASAGISNSKFVAKIASDVNKPNGQKTIPPEEVEAFLEDLPIEKFFGIGKVTAAKMFELGIFTGRDLKRKSREFLQTHFKNSGVHYYKVVRGLYQSDVKPDRIQKSVAAEYTFSKNLTSEIYMMERLKSIASDLESRLKKSDLAGKTVTLKIKYSDFSIQTRSKTLSYYIRSSHELLTVTEELLYQEKINESVRLLGISVSNLNNDLENKVMEVQLKFEF